MLLIISDLPYEYIIFENKSIFCTTMEGEINNEMMELKI